MSVEVVRGTSQKPVASAKLAGIISNQSDLSGRLFIGFPVIGTSSEGTFTIDALLVSKDKGITIFDLVEGSAGVGDFEHNQDNPFNKLESKLRLHPNLMSRRDLLVKIHTLSFAPGIRNLSEYASGDYRIANSETLADELKSLDDWTPSKPNMYEETLSVLENVSTIRQNKIKRETKREDSRGAKLKRLEKSISTLDEEQSKAVIETVEGVQRIRGLAGSGKTIVLALKAAYLHAQRPDWRIAVTFNTRALKGLFQRLIEESSRQQGNDPDWENLRIIHAWGARGGVERDGIYHEFCRVNDVGHLDLRSARMMFGRGKEFAGACERALNQVSESQQIYDAILVDEAQDVSADFLRLCYKMLKPPHRLVYAYDELQSLTGEFLPPPEEIFGSGRDGTPNVQINKADNNRPRGDIILEKCYRNSRPVLVTAHALGFGVYREPPPQSDTGLIQMFDYSQLWEEIGYEIKQGELREGSSVTLHRTGDTSPTFLEEHSETDDLVQFKVFDSEDEQAEWLTNAIKHNLENDELRHDDIIVINPDPRTTRGNVGRSRRLLLDMGINSHIAGVDTDPNVFFNQESVTFTGIYRAKGNEAGMVYVINAQDCHGTTLNLANKRNQLFTAITRSKAWVRVLGVGDRMRELEKEYTKLKDRNFELRFDYPTAKQREQLRIVHRDMNQKGVELVGSSQKSLSGLIQNFKSGNLQIEDLDRDDVATLKDLLNKDN